MSFRRRIRNSHTGRRITRAATWLGLHQLSVLISIITLFGGTWAFVELADEVMENETVSIDERLLLSLRNPQDSADPIGAAWVEEMGRDITALGGTAVLTFVTVVAIGYLLLRRKFRAATFTGAAVVGGILLSTLLKIGIDRPRPDLVPHDSFVYTASFPSGHSMLAAVTYLTLAALLSGIHTQHVMKAYLMLIAVFVTVAIGISRVYLGVHWPTDVLAGWTAGAAWAALVWLLERWLQRSGMVEGESGLPVVDK